MNAQQPTVLLLRVYHALGLKKCHLRLASDAASVPMVHIQFYNQHQEGRDPCVPLVQKARKLLALGVKIATQAR
jgi:hypothetical protein